MRSYADYIAKRGETMPPMGLNPISRETMLFDFQRPIVDWALGRGRAAIFADTGLGKSAMQLHWAEAVADQTGGAVLILAPLAVSAQTIKEAKRFDILACRANPDDTDPTGVVITNYEHLSKFDPSLYSGIVLDESSILKGLNGKVRGQIQSFSLAIQFRLSCTATPAPNDPMEIGTQAEFVGVMSQSEMLAMYFTHDSSRTSKWRLKGHAKDRFFEWMASWSVILKDPADLGFDNDAYQLPPMSLQEHVVGDQSISDEDMRSSGLLVRGQVRKATMAERCERVAEIANAADGQVLVWCNLNDESTLLAGLIDGAVEVSGSDKPEHKEQSLLAFAAGEIRVLVTKPRIAGFGMNFQSCAEMVFTGLSDSWEQYYQAIRRIWRYGQKRNVTVHVVSHADEGAVVANIKRKDDENRQLSDQMRGRASSVFASAILAADFDRTTYIPAQPVELPLL